MSTLQQAIEIYTEARREAERLGKLKAEAERSLQSATARLIDEMQAVHMTTLTLENGLKPTLVQSVRTKPLKQNEQAVRGWLEREVEDPHTYFEERLIERRLNALVKDRIEKGFDPSELPPELNIQTRPSLRVVGWDRSSENESSEA